MVFLLVWVRLIRASGAYSRPATNGAHCHLNGFPRYIGVGVGWHRLSKYVCVVTLCNNYREKPRSIQQTMHERFIQMTLGMPQPQP